MALGEAVDGGTAVTEGNTGVGGEAVGATLPQAAALAAAAIAMTARVQVDTCLGTSTPFRGLDPLDEQTVAEFSYTL